MASFRFEDKGTVGDNASGSDRSRDTHDPSPLMVVEYIEQYGNRFDEQRSSSMILAGDVREI